MALLSTDATTGRKSAAARLEILSRLQILDTPPAAQLDDLLQFVCMEIGMPMGAISLIDEHRQWFKSKIGITHPESPLADSFCAYAILEDDVLVVENAEDDKFSSLGSVVGSPFVKFYAGAPVLVNEDVPVGTVCIFDSQPRKIPAEHVQLLKKAAVLVSQHLTLHQIHLEISAKKAQYEKTMSAFEAGMADFLRDNRRTLLFEQ